VFLQEVLTGEQDLTKCAKKAYEGTLKRYHGWMVQSIFSVCLTFHCYSIRANNAVAILLFLKIMHSNLAYKAA
jgi:hypothetical protein